MKARLSFELFGEDSRQAFKLWQGVSDMFVPGFFNSTIGGLPPSGWTAELTGFDPKYKYDRSFLRPKKDYSRANSKGSRGVFAEYILESGRVYEVKESKTWQRFERYFCKVNNEGDIIRLTEKEVLECLKSRLE